MDNLDFIVDCLISTSANSYKITALQPTIVHLWGFLNRNTLLSDLEIGSMLNLYIDVVVLIEARRTG